MLLPMQERLLTEREGDPNTALALPMYMRPLSMQDTVALLALWPRL